MASILWNIAKAWKEKFTQRDSKLNFVVPKSVVNYYWTDGKKDDRNLNIWEANFRFQIGKMDKRNETIYSNEIILWWLEYLFKKVKNDDKIIIQLRPDLSKYLCNDDQKENGNSILSFQQEKEKIEKLIKKHFKGQSGRFQIVNVSENYPEIFHALKNKGRKWLVTEKLTLTAENISAMSIAQYLYHVSQKNKKFMEIIYNTKGNKQKQADTQTIWENESDYYALIEVAIRLYEILTGINVQWWVDRQTKYDRIIWWILYWQNIDKFKIEKYPDLLELHEICNKARTQTEFERIYVTSKEIRELEDKKIARKGNINKIIGLTSLMLVGMLGWWGGSKISEYHQEKKQAEKNQKFLEKSLSDKHVKNAYIVEWKGNIPLELQTRVNEATERMYNDFLQIYGSGATDERSLDMVKKLMKQYFLEADGTWVLVNIDAVYGQFLVTAKLHKALRAFVAKYWRLMTESGFSLIPRPHLQEYSQACEYTQGLQWNIVVNYWEINPNREPLLSIESDSTKYQKEFNDFLSDSKRNNPLDVPHHSFAYKRCGNYLHSNGENYDVLVIWGNDDEKIILAYERKTGEDHFDSTRIHQYTKANWVMVAKDFLENRKDK